MSLESWLATLYFLDQLDIYNEVCLILNLSQPLHWMPCGCALHQETFPPKNLYFVNIAVYSGAITFSKTIQTQQKFIFIPKNRLAVSKGLSDPDQNQLDQPMVIGRADWYTTLRPT